MNGSFSSNGISPEQIFSPGEYNLSLSGFGTDTVSLERSLDGGSNWVQIEILTENAEKILTVGGQNGSPHRFRITGYGSGTIRYFLG